MVFEASDEGGRVLTWPIPALPLQKEIVRAEVGYLKKLGGKVLMDLLAGRNGAFWNYARRDSNTRPAV